MRTTSITISALALAASLAVPAACYAQADNAVLLDLPEQPLGRSIRDLSAASGITIIADDTLLEGRQAGRLKGRYGVPDALARLLAGTGLRAERVGASWVIRPVSSSNARTGDFGSDPAILVTGTRIRGAGATGSQVITLGREEIDRSGLATTQQILAGLPQNFGGGPNEGTIGFTQRNNATANIGFGSSVNLRGLGTSSTLTLVDGNRFALGGIGGAFVDVSLIPASAIERIEVLPDGASAIYGSDAVVGVVNVRLRNAFEGAETRGRYGAADGFDELQASQILGFGWNSGHLVASYEYFQRGRLSSNDRPFGTEDLRAFGGPDYRQAYGNPATLVAANGSVFAVPAGQDGTALAASDLIAGQSNTSDGRKDTDLLPRVRRHSAFLSLEQGLGSILTANVQGFLADRRSSLRYFPINSSISVTPANPFYVDPIGTGQPVSVRYDFREDFGAPSYDAHVRAWALSGSLAADLGAWRAELRANHGQQRETLVAGNVPNNARLAQALLDPDPASAFNLFGDGSNTAQATIDYVRGGSIQSTRTRQTTLGAKLDGPLFTLPAGTLRVAIGGEFRHERVAGFNIYDDRTLEPVEESSTGFPLSRDITAGYAELLVPLVSEAMGLAGIEQLDLSVAGRYEHYSDFGSTFNPKVGLAYRPFADLTLRGTYGTSFRAPGFLDVRQGPGLSSIAPLNLSDPQSPTGVSQVLARFGNDAGIGPEKARTLTAGFDLRPVRVPRLHLGVTWFDIAYRDRISNPSAELQTYLVKRDQFEALLTPNPDAATVAALYADPTFFNPFGIDASAIDYLVDSRNKNSARAEVQGLDFDLGYTKDLGGLTLDGGVSGSWIFHFRQKLVTSAPYGEVLATSGNPVDLRARAFMGARWDGWGVSFTVNHTAGYRNTAVAPAEPVSAWTTLDAQITRSFDNAGGWLSGTRVSLNAVNLFDAGPPYVNNRTPYSASGFDPEKASPVGRLIALQVIKAW